MSSAGVGARQARIVSLCCAQTDGHVVFGGCTDGSIRCWIIASGNLEEVYRHGDAHVGPVTSLSIASEPDTSRARGSLAYNALQFTKMIISGGEDCSVKVWRVHCSGDYF